MVFHFQFIYLCLGLRRETTIKKISAIFLLLVFAVSTAPKIYFHDLIADHKDFSTCHEVHKLPVLHQEGYNCHFDDLVVTAPYVLLTEQPVVFTNFYFEKKRPSFCSSFLLPFFQHKENRGPPSV
jgi:hypothetical protein